MIKITTVNDYSFKIEAFGEVQIKPKGYENYVSSNKLQISSKFDSDDILVPYTSFNQYTVNNVVFSNILDLQLALSSVLFNSASFSGAHNETLKHFIYNPVTDKLEADRAIETTLNSLFLGEQHKMSSGSENIFFTNLTSDVNFFPMWGGLKDQSLTVNQGASGFIPPSGRIYSDMFSLPLRGNPNPITSVPYSGDNYFGVNITGLGITTTAAEDVSSSVRLEYRIEISGKNVYKQVLPRSAARSSAASQVYAGDVIEWFFDHPVDVRAGTTLYAEIMKVDKATDTDLGIFLVREGDVANSDGSFQYQSTVHNRLFEDKDLELISPYLKYKAMDFGLDSTGSTVLLRDLSLGADSLLVPHAVNTLEAVVEGTEIKVKIKGGAKILVESLPVNAVSINGSFVNSVLNQAVVQLNNLFTNTEGFASGGGNPVTSFVLSGDDLTIGLEDGTSYTVDVTTLGVDENKFVSSGALNGSDLVLTMNDATEITIDATNMINGSTETAINDQWHYSYGDRANESVNNTVSDMSLGIAQRAPFYWDRDLTRGTEFRWNFNNNKAFVLGVWDGATYNHSGTYNSRQQANWSTGFWRDTSGFRNGTNVTLTNTTTTDRYVPSFGATLAMRFLNDGHIVLMDLSGATEVEIARTNNALVDTSFQLQLGCDAQFVFPQFVVTDTANLWEIAHDYNGTESGILNGILDHTVIKSDISIEIGEKIMFMLDEVGAGDFFGTNYTNAATSIITAETQLDNTFVYQTNEALVFTQGGANDWNMNTNANGYFFAASLDQYREGGGSGTVQGMFSLRFNTDGKLTIYDEDAGVKVATAKMDPTVGSSVNFYMGVKGNRAYYSIPVISKQNINGGSQPDVNFAPTVADQTVSVEEGDVLNYTIIDSDNIVNQYVEVDAPSWMSMDQSTGVLSGTSPSFLGTSADTIVVNCKAGNAIGGTIAFTVTVSVTEIVASYTNTKSLSLNGTSSYLNGNATLMDSMDRATNGDGNEWSISMWVKPNNNTGTQTLFVYGAGDDVNGGAITIKKVNANNIIINYGTTTENIILFGNAFTHGNWSHLMVTFDGGTTGNNSADVNDYYSRFNVYVNGALTSMIGGSSASGYTGVISGENTADNIFRIGRASNVHNNYFDGVINQVAIWSTDESVNIADIYNSGVTHDLSLLTTAPTHYYEIENSITTITDKEGNANLGGYNFTSSDLVTDTP